MKSEKQNITNESEKKGYVTFADILGWKGIWKEHKMNDMVARLLSIEKSCNAIKNQLLGMYIITLLNNELKHFNLTDEEIMKIRQIQQNGDPYNHIIEIIRKTNYYEYKIFELEKQWKNKYPSYPSGNYSKQEVEKNDAEIEKIHKLKSEHIEKFNKIYSKLQIEISVVLISDTFVITSSSEVIKKEDEIQMHIAIVQHLIGECLNHKLLVRGATSYGEYYHDGTVFVGSAIDDAASWHELGEEIGIYMTPKGYLCTEDLVDKDSISVNLLIKDKPKLKKKEYCHETYIVNWGEYYYEFNNVISEYKTILPEISSKIMNSKERGEIMFSTKNKEKM